MSDKQNELVTVTNEATVNVEIAKLNRGCTQLRCKMDPETVTRYAEKYEVDDAGELVTPLPPIVVFKDGKGTFHLADGFHRVAAAEKRGLAALPADVRPGTEKEAILFAAGCNDKNGLAWTNKDKRNAVKTFLTRWSDWSNHKIASYCCCSHVFVGKVRKELEGKADPKPEKVKKEPKESEPVDDTKNRLALLVDAAQKMADGIMEVAMGWVDTETGERKPFMGCRDDIQWEDGRKAIERAIRDVRVCYGPGNIKVWREQDSIRFKTYYTGGERQASSDTWNGNGVEVTVSVRVVEGHEPEPAEMELRFKTIDGDGNGYQSGGDVHVDTDRIQACIDKLDQVSPSGDGGVIDTVATTRSAELDADQSEGGDAGEYEDVDDSADPRAELCEAFGSKLTSMLKKSKRGRGRPKSRFVVEKHEDGYYVVDREGEVDDEGPFKTKKEADARCKERNAEYAA